MWAWLKERPLRSALVLFWLAVIPLISISPEHQLCHHMIRALGVAVGLGITVAYAPGTLSWFRASQVRTAGHGLVAGVWLLWLGVMLHVAINIAAQFSSDPPAVVHNVGSIISLWIAISGGMLMFASTEGIDSHSLVSVRAIKFGIAVAIAVFIAFMLAFSIDIHRWWNYAPYWTS